MKSLPCKDRKATILALTLSSHNLPTNRARELFKPPNEAKHLLGSVFKKSETFVFKHFSVWRHNWEVWNLSDDVMGPWEKDQVAIQMFFFKIY